MERFFTGFTLGTGICSTEENHIQLNVRVRLAIVGPLAFHVAQILFEHFRLAS